MGYKDILKNHKQVWNSEEAKYSEEGDTLKIAGHPVMEKWETPYMKAIADIAASNGGEVLEVGFGMGISAGFIQKNAITRHTIIEANSGVFKKLEAFARKSTHAVRPIKGLWQDSIKLLEKNSFDGILYDTYPLSGEDLHIHHFNFLQKGYELLKKGGILSYCNLTSWGNLVEKYSSMDEFFTKTQIPHLEKIGFSSIDYKIIEVHPTKECEYYSSNLIVAPILRK